jgi:hypothetical protein
VKDATKVANFGTTVSTIKLGGVPYRGPFTLASELFIGKSWNFGVHEPLPDTVRGHDPGNGGNFFKKIFNAADFVAFFQREYSQPGLYKGDTMLTDNRAAPAPPPDALPDFEDARLQQASMPLRKHYQRYLHATDPAEQEPLRKQGFELLNAFTHATADLLGKLGRYDATTSWACMDQPGWYSKTFP